MNLVPLIPIIRRLMETGFDQHGSLIPVLHMQLGTYSDADASPVPSEWLPLSEREEDLLELEDQDDIVSHLNGMLPGNLWLAVSRHSGSVFYMSDMIEIEGLGPVDDSEIDGSYAEDVVSGNWYPLSALHRYENDGHIHRRVVELGEYEWSESTQSFWSWGESPDREDEDEDEDEDRFDPDGASEDEPPAFIPLELRTPSPQSAAAFSPTSAHRLWERSAQGRIRGYSSNVLDVIPAERQFRFVPTERLPNRPLWLGVELEVEPQGSKYSSNPTMEGNYIADTHDAVKDFAIMKTDSSLSEYGFEIVSVPATLGAHYELWRPFFSGPAKLLESWASGRCGMHVHVSRDAVSDLVLGRFLVFINNPANARLIERVAGRGSNNYAMMSPKKLTSARGNPYERASHQAVDFGSRNDGKTFEVRIFRGNVSAGGFFKNLEFVHAAVHFCRDATNSDLSGDAFLRWLQLPQNLRTYRHLARWASEHGIINIPKRNMPEERMFETI